jgi:uncharacterized protein (UPF0218 family)
MLRLPAALRADLTAPMGPIYESPEALLADAGDPIVAVGDVVAHHLFRARHSPRVAVVDGRTEREAAPEPVRESVPAADLTVANEAGTLSRDLLVALRDAAGRTGTTVIEVEGEEDLATVPALLVTPVGGSVVYGQPGEGMVLVRVDEDARERARDLLRRMDGDGEAALALLDGR